MAFSFFKPKPSPDLPLSKEMRDAAEAARERLEQRGLWQDTLDADRRAQALADDPQFVRDLQRKAADAV